MSGLVYNTIGTVGVVIILMSYFLLQTGRIQSHQLLYSVLNFIGSSMILISLMYDFNLPSAIVEAAWAVISMFGIGRGLLARRKRAS